MQLLWLLILSCPCALAKKGRGKLRQGRVPSDIATGQTQAMINTDTPAYVTSKSFISLTLDPFLIRDLPWADPQTLKLAKMLSPAWFKIAPTTDVLEYDEFNFTMFQWAAVTHFTSESGMTQLWDAGIFGRVAENWKKSMRGDELEDTVAAPGTNHDFPPLIDQIGFVMKTTDLDKIDTIKEIFPAYDSPSLQVFGPEVEFFNNYGDVKNFSTWLGQNVDYLNAITYRPSPHVKTGNSSLASILGKEASDLFKLELMVLKGTFEQLGLASKPVMISDARFHWDDAEATHIYKNSFGLTLLWAERLGIAAANGIQAVFQPDLLPMHERGVRLQPSPDFWFAALHKKLVGERVLSLRSKANGDPKCSLFAYCTPTEGLGNYAAGAVTVMGINMGDVELFGNITNGSDGNSSMDLHHYLFTGNIDESKIYLNGELLNMDYENNSIPQLKFSILPHASPLIMPPHSISFWVLPDAKAAACMAGDLPTRQRRSVLDDDPDTTHLAVVFPVENVHSTEDELGEECAKGKRCHRIKKPKYSGENASECPDGCYPSNQAGGCGLRGLKIMAPGCSTQQVLERLIYITNQRKDGCCCDGAGNCAKETDTEGRSDNANEKPKVEKTKSDYTTVKYAEGKSATEYPEPESQPTPPENDYPQYPPRPVQYTPKRPQPPPQLPTTIQYPPKPQPTPKKPPSKLPVDYSPPNPQSTSHEPLSHTTQKPRFTFYYNPDTKRFVTEYVTNPVSTASSPIYTTTTPSTPEEPPTEENPRSDAGEEPVVEKETPSPTAYSPTPVPISIPIHHPLRTPYRFQGHFNGLIHPLDHDIPVGCFEGHQTGLTYPDCPHVDEHHEVKDYSNLGYHPEPQPLLQSFYYPAEQHEEEVTSSPSRRCSDCDEEPDVEARTSVVEVSAEEVTEELVKSQQMLQELNDSVEKEELILDRADEVEKAQEDFKECARNSKCLRQMSTKIKTALAVLNWLKAEDSAGR